MKKIKSSLLVLFVVLALVLTSCGTSIGISRLVPAKVDVSGYKTIAVRSTIDETHWVSPVFWNSTVPFISVGNSYWNYMSMRSYLDFNVSSRITDAASNMIYKSINTGYFKVLDPSLTDSIVNVGMYNGNMRQALLDNGIDAILTTKITNLYYDEYITGEVSTYSKTDKAGVKYNPINFYLIQKYEITISYTLSDVENNKIIATGTFSSDMKQNKTQIGHTIDSKGTFEPDRYTHIDNASTLFQNLIKQFGDKFRNELSPHYVTTTFDFMPNKPEVKGLDAAYDALENEKWSVALQIFAEQYQKSGHIASGYNAAILYFTQGQYQKAFDLSMELYNKYGNTDALDLYYKLKNIAANEKAAEEQISSTEKSAGGTTTGGGVIGM